MNADAELVRRVTAHKSVHRRIGELLKAVGVGNRVPSSLIKAVAGQPSWRQRLRELRYPVIGWKIEVRLFAGPSGRRCTDYVLLSYKDLPEDPTESIRQFEKVRRKLKEAAQQKSKGRRDGVNCSDLKLLLPPTPQTKSPMGAMDDLCAQSEIDLPLVTDPLPFAKVLVKHSLPLLTVDDHAGGNLPNVEPLFQVSLPAI
jgi:hypothetical protein